MIIHFVFVLEHVFKKSKIVAENGENSVYGRAIYEIFFGFYTRFEF